MLNKNKSATVSKTPEQILSKQGWSERLGIEVEIGGVFLKIRVNYDKKII